MTFSWWLTSHSDITSMWSSGCAMAIREILDRSAPGPMSKILHEQAAPVTDFGPALAALVEDLIETIASDVVCVGLAAPQINVQLQVAVVSPTGLPDDTVVIINPENVVESGKKDVKRESCMSIPNRAGNVERRKKLKFDSVDLDGSPVHYELEGFAARVAAHEIDHLKGVLYAERVSEGLIDFDFDEMRARMNA